MLTLTDERAHAVGRDDVVGGKVLRCPGALSRGRRPDQKNQRWIRQPDHQATLEAGGTTRSAQQWGGGVVAVGRVGGLDVVSADTEQVQHRVEVRDAYGSVGSVADQRLGVERYAQAGG